MSEKERVGVRRSEYWKLEVQLLKMWLLKILLCLSGCLCREP